MYQCFVRSASQGNRNKNKTKQMLPNQAYTAMRSKPVHPKGNQSWIFTGRTDAEDEAPTLWPPDMKGWLIWKDPDAGEDWGQEKRCSEDEMIDGITDYELDYSLNMNLSKLWGTVKDREAWHVAVGGVAKSRTWLSDWTTAAEIIILSEVSQTEKDKCHMMSPACVI